MLAVAVAKLALVDGGEQGVEDGGARLPDLVEEDHLGLRQVAAGQPQVLAILLERLDGEGPNTSSGVLKQVIRYSKWRAS